MTVREVLVDGKLHRVRVLAMDGDAFLVEVNEKTVRVKLKDVGRGKTGVLEIDGNTYSTTVERIQENVLQVKIDGKQFGVQCQPRILRESAVKPESMVVVVGKPTIGLAVGKDVVTAPIAGRIVSVKTAAGREIAKGECVCVLEAMKMQNEIAAPKTGVVKEVKVSRGVIVNKGDVLAVVA